MSTSSRHLRVPIKYRSAKKSLEIPSSRVFGPSGDLRFILDAGGREETSATE